MEDALATFPFLAPIVVPLGLSLVAFVLGSRWGARLALASAGVVAAAAGALAAQVWTWGPQHYAMGSWPAPLGIVLYADGLSCTALLMSATVGLFVSVYAVAFFSLDKPRPDRGGRDAPYFWPAWLLLFCGLHAMFLARDVFNLYVTLELLTLAAVGLVAVAETRDAIGAALQYLLAALAGSLLYLAGVALMYGAYGVLDIDILRREAAAGRPLQGALVLVMIGLMLKAALFPFHFWLPPAHGSAPAPVSAVLSGLVVKGSFYIMLRLWFELFPQEVVRSASVVLVVCGGGAIAWGSLQALVAQRLKMVVAHSTVAQLGYLFIVFGLARTDLGIGQQAWSAGALFAVSHALAKSALFLAAGTVMQVAGHDRVKDLPAASRQAPITFLAMAVASVSLMGMPPSGSFVAKWAMLQCALAAKDFYVAGIIILGGLLAAAYLFRVLAAAFVPPALNQIQPGPRRAPRLMEYVTLALALASLLPGLASAGIMRLLDVGSPWPRLAIEGTAQ